MQGNTVTTKKNKAKQRPAKTEETKRDGPD